MSTTDEKPAQKPPKKARKSKKTGRPRYEPTEKARDIVKALIAAGQTHEQIAAYLTHCIGLKTSSKTLARYYPIELSTGLTGQILVVSKGLYKNAAGAPAEYDDRNNKIREEVKPNLTAQIFFLKARAGYKDNQTVEIDPNQKPIPVSVSNLTDRQLDELEARLLGKLKKKPAS